MREGEAARLPLPLYPRWDVKQRILFLLVLHAWQALRRRAYYVPEKEQRNNIKVTRNELYVVGLDDMKDYRVIHELRLHRMAGRGSELSYVRAKVERRQKHLKIMWTSCNKGRL